MNSRGGNSRGGNFLETQGLRYRTQRLITHHRFAANQVDAPRVRVFASFKSGE